MDCRKFHRSLEDYLEGGLDFTGRFGMERHAQQCLGCGKVVADAQKLRRMAQELTHVGAPVNFEAALLHRLQKEGLTLPAWKFLRLPIYFLEWPSWRSLTVSAAAVALAVVATLLAVRWAQTDRSGDAGLIANENGASPPVQRDRGPLPQAAGFNAPTVATPSKSAETPTVLKSRAVRVPTPYSTEGNPVRVYSDPSDSDYVEYLVPGPGNRQYIVRLPNTIQMRYGQPSEEYFIRNVSH